MLDQGSKGCAHVPGEDPSLFWINQHLPHESEAKCNYTNLAMLTFLYCSKVKSKINSAKCLAPMGIEPATLRLEDLQWCTFLFFQLS